MQVKGRNFQSRALLHTRCLALLFEDKTLIYCPKPYFFFFFFCILLYYENHNHTLFLNSVAKEIYKSKQLKTQLYYNYLRK